MLDVKTVWEIREWVRIDGGDKEKTAKFMRDKLRIGGIKECREIVEEAFKRG